ncbi:hypothetical protein FACS1894156_1210 [Bacteroidia bacterium]|nr:hypothetical protein FACS1894156_1210 [Bacteroidia bacterium]
MKHITLFLGILLCVGQAIGQQNEAGKAVATNNPLAYRHNIRFSVAPLHIEATLPVIKETGRFGYTEVTKNELRSSSLYGLGYGFRVLRWLEVGAEFNYFQVQRKWMLYRSPNGPQEAVQRFHFLQTSLNLFFVYLNKEHTDLYSAIEGGQTYVWDNGASLHLKNPGGIKSTLNGQLWFFGYRYKYQWLTVGASLGYGTQGILRFDIGVRL